MKRFTSMLAAMLVAVVMFAVTPVKKAEGKQRTAPERALRQQAPQDESDYPVIYDQPEGELRVYQRSGSAYYYDEEENVFYYVGQEGTVNIVFNGNKVYIQNIVSVLGTNHIDTWVEGTLSSDGTRITVEMGQYVGYSPKYDAAVALSFIKFDPEEGFVVDEDVVSITFLVKDNTISLQGTGLQSYSLGLVWTDDGSFYDYGDYETVFSLDNRDRTLVELPENVETTTYMFKGTDTYNDAEEMFYVEVGFDGTTVYFQGLSMYLPEAWVKGEMDEEGTITIPETYLGIWSSMFMGDLELFFSEATFVYDAENDEFTSEEYTTSSTDYEMDEFADVTLSRIIEQAGTPADPVIDDFDAESEYPSIKFTIPLEDTDGNPMLGSKLSYVLWIEKDGEQSQLVLTTDLYVELEADMTEIPYLFSDDYDIYPYRVYLNQDLEEMKTWSKIGVQSIYRGGEEENRSAIIWFDLDAYWSSTDITDVMADAVKVVYYDMTGRETGASAQGLLIRRITRADGTVVTDKVLVR